MTAVIKSRIIKIGNSQGVRIPKLLLDQANFGNEVELELQGDRIIVRASRHVRHEWEEAFEAMTKAGDDELLDGDVVSLSTWDETDWQW